jgi:hypothetical protein
MFTLRFGERAYAEVQERAHSRQKITYSDLVELLEEKEAQLLRLQVKAAGGIEDKGKVSRNDG